MMGFIQTLSHHKSRSIQNAMEKNHKSNYRKLETICIYNYKTIKYRHIVLWKYVINAMKGDETQDET